MKKLTHQQLVDRLPVPGDEPVSRIPVIGMLENIRSLYNVGSIFRTSDGALVRKLLLCGFTPAPPRKEIDKTSLGAVRTVPWESFRDPLEGIRIARSEGNRICVLEQTSESRPYSSLSKSDFPLCLVVGNELTGVSAEVVREADVAIEIPMFGAKQSLNVAVAYGIALFELARVWRNT